MGSGAGGHYVYAIAVGLNVNPAKPVDLVAAADSPSVPSGQFVQLAHDDTWTYLVQCGDTAEPHLLALPNSRLASIKYHGLRERMGQTLAGLLSGQPQTLGADLSCDVPAAQ